MYRIESNFQRVLNFITFGVKVSNEIKNHENFNVSIQCDRGFISSIISAMCTTSKNEVFRSNFGAISRISLRPQKITGYVVCT